MLAAVTFLSLVVGLSVQILVVGQQPRDGFSETTIFLAGCAVFIGAIVAGSRPWLDWKRRRNDHGSV
jgi:hypothetical protein